LTTDCTDNTDKGELVHGELTRKILGCAMTVLNGLKPGLDEKLYERALVIELTGEGIQVEQQPVFDVEYRGQSIGKLIPDLIVGGSVVVDAKVVSAFNETHLAQMTGYLALTGLKAGLLINFKNAKLEWKRVVR